MDVKQLVKENMARLVDRRDHLKQIVQTVNAIDSTGGNANRIIKLHKAYDNAYLSKNIKFA